MSRPDQIALADRLLQGGIAPKHVKRLVAEFIDHHDDLVQASAAGEARARLGSDDEFVARALARPELKSWGARWPWAVYGLGPTVAAVALIAILFFGAGWTFILLSGFPTPSEAINSFAAEPWKRAAVQWYLAGLTHGLHPAIALAFCFMAVRQRRGLAWAVAGVSIVAVIGGGFDASATWAPEGSSRGELLLSQYWLAPLFPGGAIPADTFWRSLANLIVIAPGVWWMAICMKVPGGRHATP